MSMAPKTLKKEKKIKECANHVTVLDKDLNVTDDTISTTRHVCLHFFVHVEGDMCVKCQYCYGGLN